MTHIFNERTEIDGVVDTGVDIQTSGGVDKLVMSDPGQAQLLTNILKELKKINLHLAIVNDIVIENSEVM